MTEKTLQKIDIFISSSSDVNEERDIALDVIKQLNAMSHIADRYILKPLAYESIVPAAVGDSPQRTIDRYMMQADKADLFICILWSRMGTPVMHNESGKEYQSGTEYEFITAYQANQKSGKPYILLYRGMKSVPMEADFEQAARVKAFFKRFEGKEADFKGLYRPYKSNEEFKKILLSDLDKVISTNISQSPNENIVKVPNGIPELDIEKYRKAIFKRYKILDLDAMTPPEKADYIEFQLRSVFVEQDVRENPPPVELPKELMEKLIKDEKLKKEDLPDGITFEDIKKAKEAYLEKPALPVLNIITNPENPYVVILGDPGSGKSTLSRYLVLSLLTKQDEKLQKVFDNYLPLLIELRDYAAECAKNKCNTFIEYLDRQGETKGYGLTKEAIDYYLKNDAKAIVIFDGLDEIFDPAQRENIEQQIIGFATDYPKTRIITTSRIVGYKRRNLTNADFSHYTLQDFRKLQIDSFIDKWYSIALINNPDEAHARKERIDRAIEESASIRQLAGNPLLLTIMAIINKHQELPRERRGLYEHASSVLIYHWDWERKIKEWNIKIEYVSKSDKEELLRRLAYQMQSAPKGLAGNYIHADTLQAEFEKYFIERYQRNPADAKLAAQALIEQLRERNFILCRYGANLYGFIHRTFLEYFCAWSIVWKFNVKHELDIENLKGIFNEHWDDESWHEVLRLICGMIDEKFSDTLIYNLMLEPAPDQLDIVREKVNKFSEISDLKNFWYDEEMEVIFNLMNEPTPDPSDMIRAGNYSFEITDLKRYRYIKEDEDIGIYAKFWKAKRIDLAIKCMGELKNIELIRPTSSKLLKETCEMIEFGIQGFRGRIGNGLSSFVNRNLILSAISIGKRWAGREQLIEWIPKFVKRIQSLKKVWFYYSIKEENLGKFIGAIGSGDNNIKYSVESLLEKNSADLRMTGLIALVSGWIDDQDILPLLKERAVSDRESYIRNIAIKTLLEGWQEHPDIMLLKNITANIRSDYGIRKALLKGWHEDPNAFQRLIKVLKDPDNYIRNAAIEILLEDWHTHPDTWRLIKDKAANDEHFAIRNFAINALAKGWHDERHTLLLLKELAVNDTNYTVRSTALTALAERWYDNTHILNLLKDRAVNDENETVRGEAARLLENTNFRKS